MDNISFTTPALVVLLLPSVLIPLATMLFLRTQRTRIDYGPTRWLFLLGTMLWVGIACWEAFDMNASPITLASPFRLVNILEARTFRATLPRWLLLCLPAFPSFFAVLVMFRKRFQMR
jgi:hypothetical protein